MKLIEVLTTEKFGNVALTSENNLAILKEIAEEMDKPEELNPQSFYYKWIKGADSVIETLSRSLVRDYPIERIYGDKTKTIFFQFSIGLGLELLRPYIENRTR